LKQKLKHLLTGLADNFFRILIYVLVIALSCLSFLKNIQENEFNKKEVLSILISVIAIIIAIIVTYLFSKLFAEKSIRIERKKEIDELSLKITSLRRIAHHIRTRHEFWLFKDVNIKSIIDKKYPNLLYEQYRGNEVPGIRKLTYEELSEIEENIHGADGQAYLALKGLEDNANRFSFYSEVNPQNYTLNDVARYKQYAGSFWYLLDKSDDSIVNFNGIHKYWLDNISELYFKIRGKQIDEKNYKSQIKDLFTEFDSIYFDKHYYLNSLNSDIFPTPFKSSFGNMLVFVILLIASLFAYIINLDHRNCEVVITVFLVSAFIANTVDLVLLTFKSIKNELEINEVFKL
jgi:hypothetical protein